MKKTLLITLLLISQFITAQLYISEVFLSPPGDDSPNEYIEIRGTPNATIAAGTYIVTIDGDVETSGNGPGDLESDIMNLSGLTIGSNGYLVLLTTGHPYTVDPNATIALDLNDGNIEDQSHTILLIQTNTPPSGSDDIDSDNDGTPDGSVYAGWTVLDGVAFADDDGTLPHDEYAYANVIFAESAIVPTLKHPAGATVISTTTQYDYAARIGNSTGSAVTNDASTSDWVGGDIPSGNVPNWVLSSTTDRATPNSFAGSQLNHIGSANPSMNTLSTEDVFARSNFNLYPNPVNDFVQISTDVQIDSVEVFNLIGKKVFSASGLINDRVNVSSLSTGIYILKITSGNSSIAKKIIKN
ncbi:MAG: T9SS type A sorting domain-containing protein [Flavobacteriaceae bacterium]|nr:MAG: T9SS type A sorting domain-containing protein [Flavobacteriaceae bacterium]